MLIAGSMIGSGVFIVPAEMARVGHTSTFLFAAWTLAALLTVFAALSYGELAGLYPRAGGQYAYLREIYGRLVGFLYGWTLFAVIECGTIAAVATGFGKYLATVFPSIRESDWLLGPLHVSSMQITQTISIGPYDLGLTKARLAGIAVIVLLSVVNTLGIQFGTLVQNLFTVTKIGSLGALVVLGLVMQPTSLPPGTGTPLPEVDPSLPLWIALLVVQTGALFSADAWNSVTFIAGEVKNPKRTIPIALFIGTAGVCGLYILANVAYVRVLGMSAIASSPNDRVGSLAVQALFGPRGEVWMGAAVLVSMFGCLNGLVLSGARVYHAMARDGLFVRPAGTLNARGVPAFALGIQAVWASILTLSGSYGQLLDYVIFAALLFYMLTVFGVFILRRRYPDLDRPVKAFGYPLIPALYLVGAGAIMLALLVYRPAFTWPGLAIVVLGLPVYYLTKRWQVRDGQMP